MPLTPELSQENGFDSAISSGASHLRSRKPILRRQYPKTARPAFITQRSSPTRKITDRAR